jgi:hypothetical protein
MNTYEIGQRVTLLSHHVATIEEYSPRSRKYRLTVDGWMKEHRGKTCAYWYDAVHISPLHNESDVKRPTPAPVVVKPAPTKPRKVSATGRYKEVKDNLRHFHSVTVTKRDGGEYRVNFEGGKEATAYYTNDIEDALATGIDMRARASKPVVS